MSDLPRMLDIRLQASSELVEQLSDPETTNLYTRDGRAVTIDIGEPHDDGFYTPIITAHEGHLRRADWMLDYVLNAIADESGCVTLQEGDASVTYFSADARAGPSPPPPETRMCQLMEPSRFMRLL